jgi:hypothetical protein
VKPFAINLGHKILSWMRNVVHLLQNSQHFARAHEKDDHDCGGRRVLIT